MAPRIRQCINCNTLLDGNWKQIDDKGNHICPYCYAVNDFKDNEETIKVADNFREIYINLENLNFDGARNKLALLKQDNPKSSQVYFLTVLAENYVCYTEDSKNPGCWIPTLNDLPKSNLMETSDAQKALALAESDIVKNAYIETFNKIEKVRQKILEASQDPDNQYDVFISTKVREVDLETGQEVKDASGRAIYTEDYKEAFDIYCYLKGHFPKLKVFFSETDDAKKKMAGKEYEPYIFGALHSAKALILVSEKREYAEWRWVKNEWSRYLRILEREPRGQRWFCLITKSLINDMPPEIRNYQCIDYDKTSRSDQIIEFVNNAVYRKNMSKDQGKLTIKGFEEDSSNVGVIAPVVEGELGKTEGFANRVETEVTADVKSELARIKMELDPAFPKNRERAFQDLETLIKENPDIYEAEKLMLLKGTNYHRFEDYIDNPSEIIKNPGILAQFLKIVPDAEVGRKVINDFTDKVGAPNFYFGFGPDEEEIAANAGKWCAKLSGALSNIILGYRDEIKKEKLRKLENHLRDICLTKLDFSTKSQEDVLKNYLGLCNYLSEGDPNAYINARKMVLQSFGRFYPNASNSVKGLQDNLVKEIMKVSKGDYETIWVNLCLKSFGRVLKLKEFITALENGVANFSFVKNKDNIEAFNDLVRYSKQEEKPSFNLARITAIVYDKKTYEAEEKAEGDDLSNEGKDDAKEVNDYDLSGYELFEKYIEYQLPDLVYPSTLKDKFNENSPLVNGPSPLAYQKKEKPKAYDKLTNAFAVKLHKNGAYEDAIKAYTLYLRQQDSLKSLDCILIRFYRELAIVRIFETDELRHIGRQLQHKDIDRDISSLMDTVPYVSALYKKIKLATDYQERYSEKYAAMKDLSNNMPREKTIDKVALMKKIRDDMNKMLSDLESDNDKEVEKELRREFSNELDYFKKKFPDLVNASENINKLFASDDKAAVKKVILGGSSKSPADALSKATPVIEKYKKMVKDFDNPGLRKNHLAMLDEIYSDLKKAKDDEEARKNKEKMARIRAEQAKENAKRRGAGFIAIIWPIVSILFILFTLEEAFLHLLEGLGGIIILGGALLIFVNQIITLVKTNYSYDYDSSIISRNITRITAFIFAISLFIYGRPIIISLFGGDTSAPFNFFTTGGFIGGLMLFILFIVGFYLDRNDDGVTINIGGLAYIFLRWFLLAVPVYCLIRLFEGWGACFSDGCMGLNMNCSSDSASGGAVPLFANFSTFSIPQIVMLFGGMVATGLWSLINRLTDQSLKTNGSAYVRIISISAIIACGGYVLIGALALLNGLLGVGCSACSACYSCLCTVLSCGGSSSADACTLGGAGSNLLIGLGFAALGGLAGAAAIAEADF